MPRNQTVFISLKKLKKPQKTLAENSDVSVFQKRSPLQKSPGLKRLKFFKVFEQIRDVLRFLTIEQPGGH